MILAQVSKETQEMTQENLCLSKGLQFSIVKTSTRSI